MDVYKEYQKQQDKKQVVILIIHILLMTLFVGIVVIISVVIIDLSTPNGPFHNPSLIETKNSFVVNDEAYYYENSKVYSYEKNEIVFDADEDRFRGTNSIYNCTINEGFIYFATSYGILVLNSEFEFIGFLDALNCYESIIKDDMLYFINHIGMNYYLNSCNLMLNGYNQIDVEQGKYYADIDIYITKDYHLFNPEQYTFEYNDLDIQNLDVYVPNVGIVELMIDDVADSSVPDNQVPNRFYRKFYVCDDEIYFATFKYEKKMIV